MLVKVFWEFKMVNLRPEFESNEKLHFIMKHVKVNENVYQFYKHWIDDENANFLDYSTTPHNPMAQSHKAQSHKAQSSNGQNKIIIISAGVQTSAVLQTQLKKNVFDLYETLQGQTNSFIMINEDFS